MSERTRDEWLAEFRLRRDDLLNLLADHHYHNSFGIDLHANGRARDSIADACRIAEALMVLPPRHRETP